MSKLPQEAKYVVVFRATIAELDDTYGVMAGRLRERALAEFGCLAFHALTEGNQEVALSYWPSLEAIRVWQQDPEHREAQALGRTRWYADFHVEICEVQRQYSKVRIK